MRNYLMGTELLFYDENSSQTDDYDSYTTQIHYATELYNYRRL